MDRTLVTSTALKSAGYDDTTHVLEVEFVHGGVYRYFLVPRSVYEGLLAAESCGAYYDEYVKKPGFAQATAWPGDGAGGGLGCPRKCRKR